MKIKKLAALAMSCAMVIGGGAMFAACGDEDNGGGNAFKEDTRIWYAVGNSEKGSMKANGWKPQLAVEELTFKKDTTKTDENVYTLTMDLYAGDGFKFLYKNSVDETFANDDEIWPRQVGIHQFVDVEGEGKDAVVKVGEDTVFTTKDGMDANNLYLAKGQDGTYTFTLKTFPNKGSEEVVEFSVTKDKAITIPYDMYVYGDMNDFGFKDISDYAMNASGGVWSLKIEVTAEDLVRDATGAKVKKDEEGTYAAIQLKNEGDGAQAGDPKNFVATPATGDEFLKVTDPSTNSKGEINLLTEGSWVITFTEEGKAVALKKSTHQMYFRGTGTGMTWDTCPATAKLSESSDGSYQYGYITVTDEQAAAGGIQFKLYNYIKETWHGPEDNYKLKEAGKYFVKFTLDGEKVEWEKCEYYAVGTFNGADFCIKKDVTPKLVAGTDANVVTGTLDVKSALANYGWVATEGPSGSIFAIQVVFGCELAGKDAQDWVGGGNTYISVEGEHTISFAIDTKTTTVTKNS